MGSRSGLLTEIISKGILDEVSPEIASLYENLETKFQPLRMVKSIIPAIELIKENPKLLSYNFPLQKITVIRTMRQLSRVYSSIKLDFVKKLFASIEMSFNLIEKLVIDAVTKKQLHVRIDHAEGCLRFGTTAAVSSNVDTQILTIGNALSKILRSANKKHTDEKKIADSEARSKYLSLVINASDKDHQSSLERKLIIEQRKEALERFVLYKDEMKRQADDQARETARKSEQARLNEEEIARAKKDAEAKKAKIDAMNDANSIIAAGKNVPMEELLAMSEAERREMLKSARNESLRSKEDDARRLSDQVKRLDHITRALRMESKSAISIKYQAAVDHDRKAYEEGLIQRKILEQEEHKVALVEKARLAVMQSYRSEFEADIVTAQKKEYEVQIARRLEMAQEDYRRKKVARARAMLEEELDRRREEEDTEAQRLAQEQSDRDMLEQNEMLRRQRQEEEDAAKEKEAMEDKRRREDQGRLNDMRRDKESEVGPGGLRRPGFDRGPNRGEREMDWGRRGPMRSDDRDRDHDLDRGPRDRPPRDGDRPDPFDRPRDGPRREFDRPPRDGPRDGDRPDPFDRPRDGPRPPRDGERPRGPDRTEEGGGWSRQKTRSGRDDKGPRREDPPPP